MSGPKRLLESEGWGAGPLPGSMRWIAQLTDEDGTIIPLRLVIDAYPAFGFQKVILQVIAYERIPRPVMRLCFGEDSRHQNRHWRKYDRPEGIDIGWIYGPHVHLWDDNRHMGTAKELPEDLYYARELPENIKSFDAVFWHFCNEAKIACDRGHEPPPPPRDRLFA